MAFEDSEGRYPEGGLLGGMFVGGGQAGDEFGYEFEAPEPMDHEVALRQARQVLQPQHERAREGTIEQFGHQQAQRGFYGQAPATAATQQALGDLEAQHTGQIAQMGQQLRQQDWQRGMQEQQMGFQEAQFDWQREMDQQRLDLQKEQIEREQESSFWGGVGMLAGGVIGGFLGGPAGAMAGAQAGQGVGGMVN